MNSRSRWTILRDDLQEDFRDALWRSIRRNRDAWRSARIIRSCAKSIRKICEGYPGAYWRKLEDEQAYPTEFVNELTQGGFLASLIPEEYGGSGLPLRAAAVILEEINGSGCNAGACHAQMYIMGTVLRHGSDEQKQRYLPKIATGELRLQAFGVTEPTTGSDTTKLKTRAVRDGNAGYVVNGQKVWTSRARHSDLMLLLARTTPVEEVKRRTDGLSVFLIDLKANLGKGVEIRPIDGDDQPQHHRDLLRQSKNPGGQPDRRGRQGVPLHPRRHERRAHPGRRRNASATAAGCSTRASNTPRSGSCSTGRSARTRACSSRSPAPGPNWRPPT